MNIRRIGRHLLEHHWRVKRIFTPAVLALLQTRVLGGEGVDEHALQGDAQPVQPRRHVFQFGSDLVEGA